MPFLSILTIIYLFIPCLQFLPRGRTAWVWFSCRWFGSKATLESSRCHIVLLLKGNSWDLTESFVIQSCSRKISVSCFCSQAQPVFIFANQAGLDMLETTLVALQDITLDKIFDESGRKALYNDLAKLMQQVLGSWSMLDLLFLAITYLFLIPCNSISTGFCLLAWWSVHVDNGAQHFVRPSCCLESAYGRREQCALPGILFCELVFCVNIFIWDQYLPFECKPKKRKKLKVWWKCGEWERQDEVL